MSLLSTAAELREMAQDVRLGRPHPEDHPASLPLDEHLDAMADEIEECAAPLSPPEETP